ncbi:hypothetical protein [Lentzea sp. NPDC055074]
MSSHSRKPRRQPRRQPPQRPAVRRFLVVLQIGIGLVQLVLALTESVETIVRLVGGLG